MNRLFRPLFLWVVFISGAFLLPDRALPNSGGNGSDRGGGDEYAAEFLNLRRSVEAGIEKWLKDGTVRLSAPEKKLWDTRVGTVKVFSADRVYLRPGDLSTEVSFVNEPKRQPPRITLGRRRWDEAKASRAPYEMEMMVLHELLGAVGIRDSEFEKSYGRKLKAEAEWRGYRAMLADQLRASRDILRRMTEDAPTAALRTFWTMIQFDADFGTCVRGSPVDRSGVSSIGVFARQTERKRLKEREHEAEERRAEACDRVYRRHCQSSLKVVLRQGVLNRWSEVQEEYARRMELDREKEPAVGPLSFSTDPYLFSILRTSFSAAGFLESGKYVEMVKGISEEFRSVCEIALLRPEGTKDRFEQFFIEKSIPALAEGRRRMQSGLDSWLARTQEFLFAQAEVPTFEEYLRAFPREESKRRLEEVHRLMGLSP